MTPVETTTGAVRLEDTQAGAMWLQLPNKSMLMNSKLGQRMADECQSDHQTAEANRMKLDPPPSLLDMSTFAKK
jgi:cytochrome c2